MLLRSGWAGPWVNTLTFASSLACFALSRADAIYVAQTVATEARAPYHRCVISLSEHEPLPERLGDQVGSRAGAPLFHRVAQVSAHGVMANLQLIADLRARVAERHEPHDL